MVDNASTMRICDRVPGFRCFLLQSPSELGVDSGRKMTGRMPTAPGRKRRIGRARARVEMRRTSMVSMRACRRFRRDCRRHIYVCLRDGSVAHNRAGLVLEAGGSSRVTALAVQRVQAALATCRSLSQPAESSRHPSSTSGRCASCSSFTLIRYRLIDAGAGAGAPGAVTSDALNQGNVTSQIVRFRIVHS